MKERLAELIKELGILKKDFAKELGISTGNLSDWLKGKTEPSAKSLSRIYEKYHVNLNWLVVGAGPMFMDAKTVAEKRAVYFNKKSEEGTLAQLQERIEHLEKEMRELRERK